MKLLSGGQTGVDRAALDVALSRGLPCGGYCPRGRRAEDGAIPAHYPLDETPSDDYAERTEWNVRDADATLILTLGAMDAGTKLTEALARRLHKPVRVVDISNPMAPSYARDWLAETAPSTLNVAGPRESQAPGIYSAAREFLLKLLP